MVRSKVIHGEDITDFNKDLEIMSKDGWHVKAIERRESAQHWWWAWLTKDER